MLVAAKVTPRRITDVSIVPRIPAKNAFRFLQQQVASRDSETGVTRVKPRKPTAIPNNTHKNAGVSVITPVKLKIAAITPIIILAITDLPMQLNSQLQVIIIYFTSTL